MISVTADIDALNRDLATYARLARMSMQDAVLKQGSKITIGAKGVEGWSQQLKRLTPAKGAITAARLAALKAGVGIFVRPSAYAAAENQLGKRKGAFSDIVSRKIMRMTRKGVVGATAGGRLNVQALAVKKELALRERARGFLAFGAMMRSGGKSLYGMANIFPPDAKAARKTATFPGRYGQQLSLADLWVADRGGSAGMSLVFGSSATELGAGMLKPKAMAALRQSIAFTHRDMMAYIQRKLTEAKAKARFA